MVFTKVSKKVHFTLLSSQFCIIPWCKKRIKQNVINRKTNRSNLICNTHWLINRKQNRNPGRVEIQKRIVERVGLRPGEIKIIENRSPEKMLMDVKEKNRERIFALDQRIENMKKKGKS